MDPFDGRIGKRLPHEIRGDLRFFGFYLGNETILSGTKWGIDYDIEIIFEKSDALGNIFALELFRNKSVNGCRQNNSEKIGTTLTSSQLIGEYIQSLNDKTEFDFPIEKLRSKNDNNWRDVIVRFFKDLGNRSLNTEPLKNYRRIDPEEGNDYAYWIISEGGYLERTVAIFCNVLRMDEDFNVINEEWARHRASQYILMINSDLDEVEPPFKQWETELWM